MNLAFIGNWNHLSLMYASGLANVATNCVAKVILTRNDHLRCAPLFREYKNLNTGSVVYTVEAFTNFSYKKEVPTGIYRIHEKVLEAIAWADAVIIGAEFFFLKHIIKDKPTIGIPIGFEFSDWKETGMSSGLKNFYDAAAQCDLFCVSAPNLDPARSGNLARFIARNIIDSKLLTIASSPVKFDFSNFIIQNGLLSNKAAIPSQYLFYAGRINPIDKGVDAKGADLFFAGLELAVADLNARSIKLLCIVRDKFTLEYLRRLPPKVQDLLILINANQPADVGYPDFLAYAKFALGVVETVGDVAAAATSASDALSVGAPVIANFGHPLAEQKRLAGLCFDSSHCRSANDVKALLMEVLDPPEGERETDIEVIRRLIESSDYFDSDTQWSRKLLRRIEDLMLCKFDG